MNSRQRLKKIIAGESVDRCGFWMGKPHPDTWPIYHKYFRTDTEEQLRQQLGDDLRWICPQFIKSTYRHPNNKEMFDSGLNRGIDYKPIFADIQDIRQLNDYDWPNPDYLNFDECLEQLRSAGDYYRASGFWTCFYHNVMDLLGMENYMMKMYTHPELVHSLTDKICQFYYEANERFYKAAGDQIDGFFFGNDFGTQRDLICGPAQFNEFILPWFKVFTKQAHSYGYQVILHSCGSICKVIDKLIDAGVDCLHPIQTLAFGMDACSLQKFKGRVSFMGGVDTQDLLVNAHPDEIKAYVKQLKRLLGPNLIVSPSHEALLPNVLPQNIEAVAYATVHN